MMSIDMCYNKNHHSLSYSAKCILKKYGGHVLSQHNNWLGKNIVIGKFITTYYEVYVHIVCLTMNKTVAQR